MRYTPPTIPAASTKLHKYANSSELLTLLEEEANSPWFKM